MMKVLGEMSGIGKEVEIGEGGRGSGGKGM